MNDKDGKYLMIFNDGHKEFMDLKSLKQDYDISTATDHSHHLVYKGKTYFAQIHNVDENDKVLNLKMGPLYFQLKILDEFDQFIHQLDSIQSNNVQLSNILAPMPGLILEVLIKEGDELIKGQKVCIIEAMKMENVLNSPGEGKVKRINVRQGLKVEKNQILIELE